MNDPGALAEIRPGDSKRIVSEFPCLALIVVFWVALGWVHLSNSFMQPIWPKNDALHYVNSAWNLSQGKGFVVSLSRVEFPAPRTCGFPLLLSAAYLFGLPVQGSTWVSFVSLLILMLCFYRVARTVSGKIPSLLFACFVGASPAVLCNSTQVLSDVPALMLGWLSIAILVRHGGIWSTAVAGVLLGWTVLCRTTYLPSVVLFSVFFFLFSEGGRAVRVKRLAVFWMAFTAVVSVQAGFNVYFRGDPFAHPYFPWWPKGVAFSKSFIWKTAEGQQGNLNAYSSLLLGLNESFGYRMARSGQPKLYLPGSLVLATAVVCFLPRLSKKAKLALALTWSLAICTLPHLFYLFQSSRFLIPVVPAVALSICWSAHFAFEHLKRGGDQGRRFRNNIVYGMIMLFGLGSMTVAFLPPTINVNRYMRGNTDEVVLFQRMAEATPDNAVLVADIERFLVDPLWLKDTDRIWIPLQIRQNDWRRGGFPPKGVEPHLKYPRPGDKTLIAPYLRRDCTADGDVEERLVSLVQTGRPVYYVDYTDLGKYPDTKPFWPKASKVVPSRWIMKEKEELLTSVRLYELEFAGNTSGSQ